VPYSAVFLPRNGHSGWHFPKHRRASVGLTAGQVGEGGHRWRVICGLDSMSCKVLFYGGGIAFGIGLMREHICGDIGMGVGKWMPAWLVPPTSDSFLTRDEK
jgi:hypothetical protein